MSRISENFLIRLLLIFGILVFGFFGARIIASLYYDSLVSEYNKPLKNFQNYYENLILEQKDPVKTLSWGRVLYQIGQTDLAYKASFQATQLSPSWRDAWVWRGYLELQMRQPKEALSSLKQAEIIDPIYPLTYSLLAKAYDRTGDEQSARYARDKVSFLNQQ